MRRSSLVPALAACVSASFALAEPGQAATPESYAALERQSAAACLRAANLRDASVGPLTRFSDDTGVDVRVVTGVYPQPHMRGATGTVLCLYNRLTRRVEVQEPPPGFMVASVQPSRPIKDVTWLAEDIEGGGIIDNSRVSLRLGADGRLSGRSGCNQYSGSYSLDGAALRITSPLVGTRMACAPSLMNQEGRYQDILRKARSISTTDTGFLVVTASDGRTIRFTRDTARVEPIPDGPAFQMLRCGGEQFQVSFGQDSARVELSDGSRVELMNLNAGGEPGEQRQYTNGRMTFIQTFQGPNRGVRFARGRMALISCHVAQN